MDIKLIDNYCISSIMVDDDRISDTDFNEQELRTYPNPTSGIFNIELQNGFSSTDNPNSKYGVAKVLNMQGAELKIIDIDRGVKRIDISDLPSLSQLYFGQKLLLINRFGGQA